MTERTISEARLQEIREQGAAGKLTGPGSGSTAHPRIGGRDPYYGLPALKPPVWTWEIPFYFFVGGLSGVSACMAFVAQLFGGDAALVRLLLWLGFVGVALSPLLLISDLGRPKRFLNMLRVFKWRSVMSVGVWTLVAFSVCIPAALAACELERAGLGGPFVTFMRWSAGGSAALFGLLLASYTGVLLGATAIPFWFMNRRLLPLHFHASSLGATAALLELAGFLIPTTRLLGLVASGVETALEGWFLLRRPKVNAPMHHGRLGLAFTASGLLEGPVSLLLRLFAGGTREGRWAAGACFLVGALISRYCWVYAGRVSAADPRGQFELQRRGEAAP